MEIIADHLAAAARCHSFCRPAFIPGNEIDADEWVARFRDWPFPSQKARRRRVSEPDLRVWYMNKKFGDQRNLRMDYETIAFEEPL